MDIWVKLQDRYVFVAIFILMILANAVLLYATWRSRAKLAKGLTVLIYILSILIMIASLFMLIFTLSFGFNS